MKHTLLFVCLLDVLGLLSDTYYDIASLGGDIILLASIDG